MSTPTHTLSLYDLSDEALALDALTAMDDGEWTPEADALHCELMEKIVVKADAFGGYVRDLEAREEMIAAEIARLAARRKTLQNRLQWMKTYAAAALQRMDRPKIVGTLFTLAIQKNPASLHVTVFADALPAEYVRVIPEQREPDKKALLDAVKAGAVINGVELAPTTYHLRIR
jgi:hypothetical protein